MDTIFNQIHITRQEKIFLLIWIRNYKIDTTSDGMSVNRRNWIPHLGLHHLNPPSLDRKLTSKGKIGKNKKCSKPTKGCRLKYKKIEPTMDYSFFSLQFPPLQCIQGVPYIELQKGNGGSNVRILKAFGRIRVKLFGLIWEKFQKCLDLCTHPDGREFEVKSRVYMWVWD